MTALTWPIQSTKEARPQEAPAREAALAPHELDRVVRALAADEARWMPHVRFGTEDRRWWTRLHGDPRLDVWLLTWLPGHATDLHDHGDSWASFAVTRGRLEEIRAQSDGALVSSVHPAGSASRVPARAVHDVRAVFEPAISIHAYS